MAEDYKDLSVVEQFLGKPITRPGRWALWLAVAFIVLLVLGGIWGNRPGNPKAGFFADPLGAILLIGAAASAIASGLTSAISIFWRRDRSVLLFPPLLLGAFVVFFVCGELASGLR